MIGVNAIGALHRGNDETDLVRKGTEMLCDFWLVTVGEPLPHRQLLAGQILYDVPIAGTVACRVTSCSLGAYSEPGISELPASSRITPGNAG